MSKGKNNKITLSFRRNKVELFRKNNLIIFGSDVIQMSQEALAFFSAATAGGTPVTETYKVYYNNFINTLKSSGDWTLLDSIYVWATNSEAWAIIDIKNPSRTVTLQGSYASRFTANEGWKGNGTGFAVLTNFNPGDGGSYNFTQNSASFGVLILDNDSVASKFEAGCQNAGNTQGMVLQAFNPTDRGACNSINNPAASYAKYRFNGYCWTGVNRTSSTLGNRYVNGVNVQTQTSTSTALENKAIGVMGAYNGAWVAGFYTSNSHAVFYAGGGAVSQKNIQNAYNLSFNYANITNITKRVIFEGDSRTGSVASPNFSSNSAYPKAVITGLGSGWSGTLVSESNETVQSMVSQYTTEIQPFRNTSLNKDVIVIWGGVNDIRTGARTGAQVYADIVTFCTTAKADGFKVVVVGECDSNFTSYAAMNAERVALRTLMLADSVTASGVSNVTSGASYCDYYIDIFADTRFQTYSDTTYYQADGIHLNATGSGIIANTYVLPTVNLL